MSMDVVQVEIDGKKMDSLPRLKCLLPEICIPDTADMAERLRAMTYITAERIGPREFYPLEDRQIALVVGPAGEHAVSILHSRREDPVQPGLEIKDTPPTLLRQVEAWMQIFFPGCGLVVEQIPRMNAVTLGLRTSPDTDFHRPVHVGFGVTQVLPIVVAALSADPGNLLLVENPEVHLHPAGQALMGNFLAQVAGAGVQVMLETHSDHILNGIRRAVRAGQLSPSQVTLHFFRPRNEHDPEAAQIISPQLDAAGNVDVWPDGFFDQFDKDMNHFAGWED